MCLEYNLGAGKSLLIIMSAQSDIVLLKQSAMKVFGTIAAVSSWHRRTEIEAGVMSYPPNEERSYLTEISKNPL